MIPSLLFIRTQTSHRFVVCWRRQIKFGLNEHCNVLINHPIFRGKTLFLKVFKPGESDFEKKDHWLKYLFSTHHLTAEHLYIIMIVPSWMLYGVLLLSMTVSILFKLNMDLSNAHATQNWNAISLPANGTYGFCRQDRTHPEGVRFVFNTTEARSHILVFTSGSGESEASLAIFLNGQNLFPNIPLPSGWGKEAVLRLPMNSVKTGPNHIEFRVISSTSFLLYWGVRNVNVIPEKNFELDIKNIVSTIDKIRSLLQKEKLQGPELARYYEIVNSMSLSGTTDRIDLEREDLKRTIEIKMLETINNVLVQSRAARIMGDEKSAVRILDDARMWIPRTWVRGLEVLDGIRR